MRLSKKRYRPHEGWGKGDYGRDPYSDRQYTDEELEVLRACDKYRCKYGKSFLSVTEIFRIISGLGYRRVIQFYFMPITGTATTADPRVPKYAATDMSATAWTMMDFGNEPFCLVAADVTPSVDSLLVAHTDVFGVPTTLDAQIGTTQQAAFKTYLESFNLPAGWVLATMLWRDAIHTICAVFQYLQRLQSFLGTALFGGGVTLATTFGSLPAATQTDMINAATSLGYSTAGLSSSTTLRTILKNLADQLLGSIQLGGQSF